MKPMPSPGYTAARSRNMPGDWGYHSHEHTAPAKAKFAIEADGWLVAYASSHRHTVVTNEQRRPESKNRILLPDVCGTVRRAVPQYI